MIDPWDIEEGDKVYLPSVEAEVYVSDVQNDELGCIVCVTWPWPSRGNAWVRPEQIEEVEDADA